MEKKKTDKANLENKRTIFLQVGFIITLSVLLLAFEWTTSQKAVADLGDLSAMNLEEDLTPITRQEEVKPPPPPPKPQVTEILNIVQDDVEIEDELEITDIESNQDIRVDITNVDEEEEDPNVFFVVEDMPIFMPDKCKTKEEGDAELNRHIARSIKYPDIARENGIQGRVYVSFVVSSKGKVTEVKILRGVDPSIDQEAIRVIQNLPDFSPGKQRGKPVKVAYNVPINFKLN
jgi:periplasmic protein TonB